MSINGFAELIIEQTPTQDMKFVFGADSTE